MSPEKQNIAIAESLGWKMEFNGDHEDPEWYWIPPNDPDGSADPPNYHSSLDACAEFEAKLTDEEHDLYRVHLWMVVNEGKKAFRNRQFVSATAAQRAEARVRMLGKWKEPVPKTETP